MPSLQAKDTGLTRLREGSLADGKERRKGWRLVQILPAGRTPFRTAERVRLFSRVGKVRQDRGRLRISPVEFKRRFKGVGYSSRPWKARRGGGGFLDLRNFGEQEMANPLKQVFNKDRTFRPKRKFEPGTQRFELHKKAQASLNAGLDLKLAVQLPHDEELNDWVAVHVVDFFNRINLIYGTISDYCTEKSCPVMSGGPKYEYRWQDEKYRKPTALSAPKYMNLLMDWIEVQINNEDLFPTNVGTPFPKNFLQLVKKILSRLFRVFVHVYIHHFDRIAQMGSEAHVNTCYKHFYYFVKEFNLIDNKELEPLKDMTSRMCH